MDEFLEAMERLISSRFTIARPHILPSAAGGFYFAFDINHQRFMLYDDHILSIGFKKIFRFDIADPNFNPEDIIKWISDSRRHQMDMDI